MSSGTWAMTPPAPAVTPPALPAQPQSQARAWWTAGAAFLMLLLLVAVVVVTVYPTDDGWTDLPKISAVLFAAVAAVLVMAKEVAKAFALSSGFDDASKKRCEAIAGGCSVFAVVFGAPTVAATIFALITK